jgi:hypothetical protein
MTQSMASSWVLPSASVRPLSGTRAAGQACSIERAWMSPSRPAVVRRGGDEGDGDGDGTGR